MTHAHRLARPLLYAAILAGATPCDALELFVAPGGNDSWSGKVREAVADGSDGPFATPQRAVQAAREWRAASADASAPITIRLRGGLYRLRQTLVLTPADSGTASAPLIIEACPGEQPVLNGGRVIAGWTVGPDGRWRVMLPEARDGQWKLHQLFVNGQRRFPPRVPRQGYHYVRGRSREQEIGGRKFFVNPGEIQPWRNLADVEVILFHQWVSSRHTIESFDTTTHSVLLKDSARWLIGTFEPNQRYYLENIAEALGAPGDWYLDRTSGELTYCPLPGETPAEAEVIAPVLRTLVSFEGNPAAGRFVEHVTLRGLSLRHAERGVAPADMAKDNQSSVDGFDAAIRARGLLNSTIENCEVAHVGEHAVRLHEGCRANRIERCHLHDLGGGGIYLGEAQIPHHEGRAPAAAPMQTGGNTIHNNFIHDGGHLFPAGIGVFIGHSAGNRVTHNEISSFNHLGISVGRTWGFAPSEAHHNQIEFNHVHHIANGMLSDGGAIYTLGVSPGTTIRHNVIHHVAPFNPRLLANGIYLDEGSSHILVENNLVHAVEGCAFLLHFGHDNLVRNNIFAVQGSLDPFCFRKALDPQNQVTFERNIVIDRDRADWFPKFAAPPFQMNRNLYWDTTGRAPLFNGHTLQQWQALGHDRDSLFVDPQFKDAGRFDFRLAADSPVRKLGFVPFDPAQAGLTGDAAWVKLPAQCRDRPLADRTAPPPTAPRPIHTDYEQQTINEWPWDAVTWALLANKRNVITNEDTAEGRQSLKLTSAVTFYEPRLRDCAVRVAFDVKLNAAQPVRLDLQLRDWRGDPFKALTYIAFQPDGTIDANGILTRVPPGTWMHVELTFELRPHAPGFGLYKLRVTPADGTPVERTLPLATPTCRELTWLGLVMAETSTGAAYIDNLLCEPLAAQP